MDSFEDLEQKLSSLGQGTDIIALGDFNARTGTGLDYIRDEDNDVKQESSNTHIGTHIRENLYSCNTCSKIFDRNNKLVSHMKIHIDEI